MNIESIQIHFNSATADSYNNGSTCDCNFSLPMIELPSQHYIYISVQNAVIPYTFYNINSANNQLSYTVTGYLQQTLIIPPGNYNALQLGQVLTSNMTGFTVTYNSINNRYTIVNSTSDFTINTASTALALLGLQKQTSIASVNKSIVSIYNICLLSKQCVCVQSNLLTGNINNTSKSEGNILVSIPVVGQPYGLITYFNYNNIRANLYTNTISLINIRLCDQRNTLLDVNGVDWSMTLQIDVVKFVE